MANEQKYISSVKLPDGSVYELKDIWTREILDSIFNDELIIDCGGAPIDSEE